MRTDHIRSLTGVRFFAALWVVCYHIGKSGHVVLLHDYPNLFPAVRPLTGVGMRGVDLFFVLSGFVLTLNYLDQLGPRFRWAVAGRFTWLRLARIWPMYMAATMAAGLALALRAHWLGDQRAASKITAVSFLRQITLTQLWDQPGVEGHGWDGPAWSLSAEWLAYLLTPMLALVVFRLRHQLRARTLFAASVLVLLPMLMVMTVDRGLTGDHAWTLRILCQFSAGMLMCAAVSKVNLSHAHRRVADTLAILIVIGIVGWLYLVVWTHHSWMAGYVLIAFVPLIGCLAMGTGPLDRLLGSRALVIGGLLSYSLYLIHRPYLDNLRVALRHLGNPDPLTVVQLEAASVPLLILAAWLCYRFIEEPARRGMVAMFHARFDAVDHPLVPSEDAASRP